MASDREFDLVLVGATGFVGRLTAAHLARNAGEARIALAGRNRGRLEKTRAHLPAGARGWTLIETDVTDAEQAAALAARTTAVCSTVGPYEEYGKRLVAACAKYGTHYCDLSGEVSFVKWSIEANESSAARSGARIVHSCGFDSIPSDLGVFETARAARDGGDGTLTDTVTHVRSMRGGLSGGTFASMFGQFERADEDPGQARLFGDPYALLSAREAARAGDSEPRRAGTSEGNGETFGVTRDRATDRWEAPFFMSTYNRQVVWWSNARSGWSYGPGFRYAEVMDTGRGVAGAARAAAVSLVTGAAFRGMRIPAVRDVFRRLMPAAGEGPSQKSMDEGRFAVDVDAVTTSGARYRTRIADQRDPGYTGTAVMLGESALALALDDLGSVTTSGGVYSPAVGLGELLVRRLRDHGFRIESGRLHGAVVGVGLEGLGRIRATKTGDWWPRGPGVRRRCWSEGCSVTRSRR
ncbi:saccharopine dehydrogenase family protein [Mobilicoccus massiliensis]|uniref:saccharopine dehydrogenase family protein n=1 Tax=Mobilicoccus massiliensis TaxID=1522310 RepID=UPI0009E5F2C5|nr:saccharopine dehydrogenase NADP-binding domain-containing protein [Mobilicoccus massiliensis]